MVTGTCGVMMAPYLSLDQVAYEDSKMRFDGLWMFHITQGFGRNIYIYHDVQVIFYMLPI